MSASDHDLLRTPLYDLHVELGAKMVPFAGYDMPVQYPMGILTEHQHTRSGAGLFDVSHMGQIRLSAASFAAVAAAVETLCPADFQALKPRQQRYSFFTSESGGILDDLMVTRAGQGDDSDHIIMVVNAGCKNEDLAHLRKHLGGRLKIEPMFDRALMALQGPRAGAVMQKIAPKSIEMKFMTGGPLNVGGMECFVTRSGYTGEDGFEISVPAGEADNLARKLLGDMEVKPIGLGARDSLRLEAGLCLYGNDITETTTPVEGRFGLGDPEAPPCRGRISGRGHHPAADRGRSAAQARRHPARRQGAGPRPYRNRDAFRRDRGRDHLGRFRPQRGWPGRHGLCAIRSRRDRHAAESDGAGQGLAGKGRRHAVRAAPLSPLIQEGSQGT